MNYGPPGPRNSDNPNQTPLDRAPPRGPKALFDGPPRGRGGFARGSFSGRSEYRDRDRDARPSINPERRDEGRPDWQRRERDFGSADRGGFVPRGGRGYVGRDRSASPARARRGSSEALSVHNSRPDGPPSYYGASTRGAYAGRGRGDWERSRGRGSFVGERDFMAPRSHSREDFATRDRGRDQDLDRKERSDRWEPEASRDRDLKARDHDVWQRDRSTGRQSSGSGPVSVGLSTQNRGEQNPPGPAFDPSRRRSTAFTPSAAVREWRRDGDVPDYFGRTEPVRDVPSSRKLSPPLPAPSAAASALDYGPPPVAKPMETPTESVPIGRDPVPKSEPAISSASFLPPTGPKAERPGVPSGQVPLSKPSTAEQWIKPESQPRALRPAPAAPNFATKVLDQGRDAMDIDRQSQAPVPSGPRASLLTNKPRMLSQQSTGSAPPPAGPMSAAKPSAVDFRASIPTGPRSERDGLKSRPGPPWATSNATWTSPDYNKPRPSIMNNLQSKPPFDGGRDPHRPSISAFNHLQKPRFQPPIIPRSRPLPELVQADEPSARVVVTDDNGRVVKPEEETDSAVDVDMSLNPSSEEEVDEDDLDEEDFAESEEKFRKEMRQMDSKRPPPLLEDAAIVELLLKVQFLGHIIESIPIQAPELPIDVPFFDDKSAATGLLSPEQRPEEKVHAPVPRRILGRPLSKLPINPIPTPPLEDLPYLRKVAPKFEIFEESDDEVQHEAVITAMRTEFEAAAWQLRENVEDIHSFYNEKYPIWKRQVVELDRIKLDAKQPSPRPATPVPPMPIIIAQPPTTERPSRASMRNATEYDLEKVMEESKMMEQERKEAREREAAELEASGARPNYDQEAYVPDMIGPSECDLSAFRDENWRVPPALALDIFEYIPPVDDFTEEEQAMFTKAFVIQPKRWGRIAESLPGRDYKQCIMHYYLTKNEAAYKETVRLSQPKRRRGRMPAKPRNSALGDLALAYDGGPTAVTDSGRPRRAAAPTFGEAGTDSEAVTPAPTGAKRGARAVDPTAQAGEKPTRAKKVGTGTTKRRTKKAIAEQQQAAQVLQDINGVAVSPQKLQPPTPRPASHKLKEMPVMLEPMQLMDIQTSIEQDVVNVPACQEIDRINVLGVFPGSSTAPQITSYWSVPEQTKFPDLIAYFGRDFGAIAEFMKTKSSTMIKNFYTRELSNGKTQLEDAAKRAEAMRDRGEPMGPPPTPVAPPKRRYEATPSMASLPRHVANLNLAGDVHGAVAMIDDILATTIQRSARGDVVVKPRASRDIPGTSQHQQSSQQRVEELVQRPQAIEQRPGQGPRPGYFPQERQEIRPASQGQRSGVHEPSTMSQTSSRPQESSHQFEQLQQQRQPLFQPPGFHTGHDLQSRAQPQSDVGRPSFYPSEPATQQQPREGLAHARRDSAGINVPQSRERWEREGDPISFRREPPHRGLPYGHATSQQSQQPNFQAIADPRRDVPRPASTPLTAQPEPQKPAPVKRSNIFSLLDDGSSEPAPPKRTSVEGSFTQSAQSPSLLALVHESTFQRQPPRAITPLAAAGSRPQYMSSAGSRPAPHHTAEYSTPFSPAPNAIRENWLSRFDPRQQSGATETPAQAQPPSSQYSGPSQASSGLSRFPPDMPGRQESHRATLAQLQHPGHVASPPPPPQISVRGGGSGGPFRSSSGSSQQQHSRVASLNYPQAQTQPLPGQPGSAGSTPVSALHPSRGYDERFMPQREHQLREQQVRDHQMRDPQVRDQEIQVARQREFDMQAQQRYVQARQRPQEMEQERYRYPGGTRTYTPPNAQYSTPQQPAQPQHPTHYRQFSQGGGGGGVEERR